MTPIGSKKPMNPMQINGNMYNTNMMRQIGLRRFVLCKIFAFDPSLERSKPNHRMFTIRPPEGDKDHVFRLKAIKLLYIYIH